MAIDVIARGLAASLLGSDGKISSDKMPTFSAAPDGATFYPVGALRDPSELEGKTVEEILLMMLYGVVNPTFTNPSFRVELNGPEVVTVGQLTSLSGTMVFNRGAITPAYGTSGYRSGAVTGYEINGVPTDTADFVIELIPVAGENTVTCIAHYAQGEQPLNSIGQNYSQPLPAGSIMATARVKGVYPLYSDDNSTTLSFSWFTDETGEGYQSVLATETLTTKQSFAVAAECPLVGVKQFETMTQTWQWIGGSAEASLTYFDTTLVKGDSLDYILYTNNDYLTGERELRIYIAEN